MNAPSGGSGERVKGKEIEAAKAGPKEHPPVGHRRGRYWPGRLQPDPPATETAPAAILEGLELGRRAHRRGLWILAAHNCGCLSKLKLTLDGKKSSGTRAAGQRGVALALEHTD